VSDIESAETRSLGKVACRRRIGSVSLSDGGQHATEKHTYLGAQFPPIQNQAGLPIAIKAMAAKLARLVYRMLRYGMKYVTKERILRDQHRILQINSSSGKLPS